MIRPFRQVDVFTDRLGLGNPVAVVLDGDGLSDHDMAQFARWTNLSETTFVVSRTDMAADYHVRIFTPAGELPFAGHPTIGTCHAWLEAGGTPHRDDGVIVQQCGVGLVQLRRTDGRIAFATPPLIRSGAPTDAELERALQALGLAHREVIDAEWIDNGPGWLGLLIDDPARLAALAPVLEPGDMLGVVAPNPSPGPHGAAVVVRAFFHAGGTREDPVTGSLNGSVAQWLLGSGRLQAPYRSSQGTAMQRDGHVYVDQADGEIWVGGNAVTGVDGTVDLASSAVTP